MNSSVRCFGIVALTTLCISSPVASVASPPQPLLVVLTETGSERDGLPVLTRHPDEEHIAAEMSRGIAGDLTKVYRLLQIRWKQDTVQGVEPAYLLLSTKQGGFARYGFWLDGEKMDGVAYIDVHHSWGLHGRFGAIDQIFPHELSHAILHNLGVARPPVAGANQVHAVGLQTDRYIAFDEGLAEHFQIMAVDHPGADPGTRALARSPDLESAARRHLAAYRRELTSRPGPLTRMRVGFPLWYSGDERVLRYFAVKRNEFAFQPVIPERLLNDDDPFRAYLLENVLPGDVGGEIRSAPRLLAREGVISALFHRWATNDSLRRSRRDATFYGMYGIDQDALSPLQNLYLKLYHVVGERKPTDAAQLVDAYRTIFPDEADAVDAVIVDAFLGQRLDPPPQIWLANNSFRVGTTLFDQFRGAKRIHTFDLNAASLVDLVSVPGVSLETARAIQAAAPFQSTDDLSRVSGVDPAVLASLKEMAVAMDHLSEAVETEELSLTSILVPYAWMASGFILLAATIGGAIYTFVRWKWDTRPRTWRLCLNAIGAATVAVLTSWALDRPVVAIGAVGALFGIPAALWCLRSRSARRALIVFSAWIGASLPGVLLTRPWF